VLTDPVVPDDPDLPPTNFRATRTKVGRSVAFNLGFSAVGAVRLAGLDAGGAITFLRAKNWGGQTLDLSATTSDEINLAVAETPTSGVNLENAKTLVLKDDGKFWPPSVRLDGFRYEALQPVTAVPPKQRLAWLRLSEAYTPDPYEALMSYYRAAGNDEASKQVGFAKERCRRRSLRLPGRIWSWLLQITVGHGYYTWIAGLWLVVLVAIGTVAFTFATPIAFGDAPPAFVPIAYVIDLLMPLGSLGQEESWHFAGWRQIAAWVLIGLGWWLTTAVAAGLSRNLRR